MKMLETTETAVVLWPGMVCQALHVYSVEEAKEEDLTPAVFIEPAAC